MYFQVATLLVKVYVNVKIFLLDYISSSQSFKDKLGFHPLLHSVICTLTSLV